MATRPRQSHTTKSQHEPPHTAHNQEGPARRSHHTPGNSHHLGSPHDIRKSHHLTEGLHLETEGTKPLDEFFELAKGAASRLRSSRRRHSPTPARPEQRSGVILRQLQVVWVSERVGEGVGRGGLRGQGREKEAGKEQAERRERESERESESRQSDNVRGEIPGGNEKDMEGYLSLTKTN